MISEIQGLRAVAALLVVFFHAKFISGGFLGVDIFYVISGYLITGLLLRELEKTGRLSLRKFYSRRIKRLLPSSSLVLVSTAIAGLLILPGSERNDLGQNIVASALYVSNYLFAHWQNDYQNLGATPSPVIHYWSLAVEEQFYLLWPMLLLVVFKARGREWLFRCIAVITLISFIISIRLTSTSPIWSFYSLPTRVWELGVGALLLWRPMAVNVKRRKDFYLGSLFVLAILLCSLFYNSKTAFPGWAALPPVIASAGLIRYYSQIPRSISFLLNSKIGQWLGAISYPIYLWHWPVLILVPQFLDRALTPLERCVGIALTLLLADLTHRFVEQPFRLSKAASGKVFISALATTFISCLVGSSIAVATPSTVYGFSFVEITAKPQIYQDGCQLDKATTLSPVCEYGDLRGKRTAVLFGDSHAAQWFPTLDAISIAQHWKLIVLTKSSCPAVDVTLPDVGAFRDAACKKWRANSLDRISKSKPYVVFTSSFDHYQPSPAVNNYSKWWNEGYTKLLSEIVAAKYLIAIGDTPLPTQDIPSCLTKNDISNCLAQPSRPITVVSATKIIDPTPWFCRAGSCPAIRDGIVVYRDSTHMSVKFANSLQLSFTQKLQEFGLLSQ